MKYYIALVIALALASFAAFGDTLPVPAYLVDGKIVVTTRDGKQHHFSSNEYAVVRRMKSAEKTIPIIGYNVIEKHSAPAAKENRVYIHGGIGNTNSLDVTTSPGVATVTQNRGFVFGGSYARSIGRGYSVMGTYLSNDTVLLGLGLDF